MQITVEISFYPLSEQFGNHVLDFLSDLRGESDVSIMTNQMSTQITGDYDQVMSLVNAALKQNFQKGYKASVVMKIFNEGLELKWLDLA
ncbi:MAG: hypothetical protein HKN76_17930 [Saprospiraceae bacterium]|nr:hypothetical protein [Saprospiraceae bacterium]